MLSSKITDHLVAGVWELANKIVGVLRQVEPIENYLATVPVNIPEGNLG